MHKDLENAIANDNLVLFVGAGMSIPLGFPSWNGLMIEILKDLQIDLGETPTKFPFTYYKDLGNKIDVFEVLDDLERCSLKQRVEKILYTKINTIDFSSKSLEKHQKLWQISSKIITTNYDKVLEKVKPDHIEAYSNKNAFQQSRSLQGNPYLYKIHGDISDVESCILFSSDYEKLYSSENPNRETLKHFFMGKTLLFLGFSLEDPFVKKQLAYIYDLYKGYTNTHFLISKGNKDLSALNINTVSIDNWNEAFDKILDELIAFKEANQPIVPSTKIEDDNFDIAATDDTVLLEKLLDKKKEEFQKAEDHEKKALSKELYKIRDRILEVKTNKFDLDFQQFIPQHKEKELEYIFDEIFKSEKLSPKLIQDINEVREQHSGENEWYHRSVLVSALACSLVNSKEVDPRKLDLLIDFTNDSENKVWQKAITYLFLVLNHLGNKWIRHKGILQPKLKGLQEKPEIQEALKAIIAFMQFNLQRVSPVNEKIFENEYFKDSPFNYFLPFYEGNPSVKKVYDDDTIDYIEEYIKFLHDVPLSDAFKYLICNTENIYETDQIEKTEEEELESKMEITNMLSIHHAFEPYLNYVNDFLNFYQNYPKSPKEIKQEITVIKITKLKNILLNTVEEHRVMARQFGLQEEWGKAITHYESLLKIEEKDESALLNLIQCYDHTKKGDDDKLKIRLRIEELLPEDHENLFEIANLFNNKDNNNKSIKSVRESLKYINKAIELDTKQANYRHARGVLNDKLKLHDKALLDYDYAIKLDNGIAKYYQDRGNTKFNLKDYEGALLDYDKAIELDAKKSDYYQHRGNTKNNLKDYEGALLDYYKAIELDAKKSDYYQDRGNTKNNLKDYQGALLDYNKAIELDSKDPDYYLGIASIYRRLDNFDKAHEYCDKASKLGTEEGRDIGTKATIYASEGKEKLFYEYLEKAFQAKARASWLHDDIKEKYKDEKRFQELLVKYNQTLED